MRTVYFLECDIRRDSAGKRRWAVICRKSKIMMEQTLELKWRERCRYGSRDVEIGANEGCSKWGTKGERVSMRAVGECEQLISHMNITYIKPVLWSWGLQTTYVHKICSKCYEASAKNRKKQSSCYLTNFSSVTLTELQLSKQTEHCSKPFSQRSPHHIWPFCSS